MLGVVEVVDTLVKVQAGTKGYHLGSWVGVRVPPSSTRENYR